MKRNAFSMDLLRPNIKIQDIVDILERKQELTPDDIQTIIDVGQKIMAAGVTIQRQALKK